MITPIEFFGQINLPTQIIIIYLIIINVITFFYFGLDKTRSELSKRRIPERMLWFLSLIGGSIGALVGMEFFHHKTQKVSFQAGIAVILALQILFLYFLFG